MALCFMDWETRSALDLTIVGGMRYAKHSSTRPLVLSWAIDAGPVKLWVPDLSSELPAATWDYVRGFVDHWGAFPQELHDFAARDDGYWVAWNMAFDRLIGQNAAARHGFPSMPTTKTLDAMAQAAASNLPGRLDLAGRVLGFGGKTEGGKSVMKQFAEADKPMPDTVEPWRVYLTYARQDTALMRDIWKVTRPLDATEWQEYWVSEMINDRGMLADQDVCRGALKYRAEDEAFNVSECVRLSAGEIPRLTMTKRINDWMYSKLPDDLRDFMVKERNEDGTPKNFRLSKDVVGRLIEEIGLSDTPPDDEVLQFLELMQFGRSSSAVKFEKILNQSYEGRLTGSYVFNGAGQTGRFCVAPDTLIDTPTGPRYIVDLLVGDKVITHRDRPGTVTDLIYKGREQMYRLTGPNGEHVTATAAHRLLTEKGWKRIDECFEKRPDGRRTLREGCAPVSISGKEHGRDSGGVRGHSSYDQRHIAGEVVAGREGATSRGEPFTQKGWRSEPDVWSQDSSGTHSSEWTSSSMERSRVYLRASVDRCQDAGVGEFAGASGGSSHRWGQNEQQPGQSGSDHEARAQVSAQAGTWSLVPVGEGEVWDISVAGDASYRAQGLIHHNSSRGVQVHNLPRASMNTKAEPKRELDILDKIAAQAPIEEIRKYGPVSSTLSKLIRPTFIAPKDHVLVWGDWSAIEARVAPWLANTRAADEAVLEPFRTGADLYILNAESIFNIPADVIKERYDNGDKEANEMRQSGKVACIAKGQLVLTDTALVPIENVTLDMRVWDGQSFVSHQGSVFKGYKDVWEYQGLIATADHVVWTTEGPCKFGDAAASGLDLVQSGSGRDQIWVGNNSDRRAEVCVPRLQRRVLREREVQWLRQGKLGLSGQPSARSIERVSSLLATAPYSEMVGSTIDGREVALSEPEASCVRELWRAWDQVPVHVCIGSRAMGSGEPWTSLRSGDRQDRCEQSLRAGEHPVGYRASTAGQQALVEDRGELGIQAGGMAVRVQHGSSQTVGGPQPRGDYSAGARRSGGNAQGLARYRGKVAVYDIINAGPNHRFTVSGKLVHNCLALGFLGGVGALKAMARGYGMKLSNDEAKKIVDGWRDRNRWARKFGDECEDAAIDAIRVPGKPQRAGRLLYEFHPRIMRGTLTCTLPDGRIICYPMAEVETVERFEREVEAITYLNGQARRMLWNGLQIENATQGTAASLLRQTLVRTEMRYDIARIVGHTHDEVITEVPTTYASAFAKTLNEVMVEGFDWASGLPLAAEVKSDWYYHK